MCVPLALGLLFAVTTACSGSDDVVVACTDKGAAPGIAVEVDPAVAARVSAGTLEVCWAGTCRSGRLELRPRTDSTCTDDACWTRMRETGGAEGFLEVTGLPATEVRATLRLTDASGTDVVDRTLDVTPEPSYPNGPDCDPGTPRQHLVVDANARLRAS
jgi:hypothetical protein